MTPRRRPPLAPALLALAVLAALPRDAAALPAEFLPVRSPLYEEIEALAARGLLDSLPLYTRPLARTDVARALWRARRLHAELPRDPQYRRLERELARELRDLDAPRDSRETGPLVDTGAGDLRLRLQAAAHGRGDYDEDRAAAHFRARDESALTARGAVQLGGAFGAYEEIGITRIRGERAYIDAIAAHSDIEMAVLRAELTARTGPLTASAGYESFRWGPGRRGTLLLSDAAGPMTFLALQGGFGRLTATALTGVLSRAEGRYLAAHRLEFAPSARLSVGLSEAVRYRAQGIDLLYAAGLLPYAIVERIQIRDASSDSVRGRERANIMLSADAVCRPRPSLSLYGELLVDDFSTESASLPDRFGFQLGLRSERPLGPRRARFVAEYTRVRNFTYSVDYGQDFIYRGRPLGYVLGPDVENVWLEWVLDLSPAWQLRSSGDFINHGEGRLGIPWIETQGAVSNAGLSGVVERRREVWGDARWMPRDNVDLGAGVGFRRVRNEGNAPGATRTTWLMRAALDVRY
ncbi:MAG TPA: capsule assembly Wzi family protein [Candidatus Eisenbacteria bacterium]